MLRERMKEGNPAPEFTFLNEKGKTVSINKLKGKIIVLDFGQVGVALAVGRFLI